MDTREFGDLFLHASNTVIFSTYTHTNNELYHTQEQLSGLFLKLIMYKNSKCI